MFFIISFFPRGGTSPALSFGCVLGGGGHGMSWYWGNFGLGPTIYLWLQVFYFLKSLCENSLKTMLSIFSVGKYLLEGCPSIWVLFRGTSRSFFWIVFILLYNFFLFLAMLHNLGYLSTLTRNWTQVAFSGSTKSKPLVSQGISCFHFKSGLCIYSSIE